MSFLGQIRAVAWAVLDYAISYLIKTPEPLRRVLVVRPDAIGDFVLWSDAGRELVAHFQQQGYSVVLLGNAVWAHWANDLGLADEVWALDIDRFVRDLRYRWSWIWRLRRAGFSKVIHPVHSRVFLVGDALAHATNAAEIIAPEGDCSNSPPWLKRWSDRWYSRLIPESDPRSMELMRHAEFMRGIGVDNFIARSPRFLFSKAACEFESVSRPYAVLFVGASWEGRVWQSRNFSDIGLRLRGCCINLVLAGGPSDCGQAREVFDQLNGDAINLVGKTSLSELASLLQNAVVVLSNETSAVHIGAAVGTPVLCILGGGHYSRFLPYVVEKPEPARPTPMVVMQPMSCFGCNWLCIHPRKQGEPVKCIGDISVEQVWHQIETVLSSPVEGTVHRQCVAKAIID